MSTYVREISTYFEAAGPHAIDREVAEWVCEATRLTVQQYTGPIALKKVLGAELSPTLGNPVNPDEIEFGGDPYVFLLTGREIIPYEPGGITSGTNLNLYENGLQVGAEIVVTVGAVSRGLLGNVRTGVHEWGHSFGLRHCPDTTCMMYGNRDVRTADLTDPFCNPCAHGLEFAGWNLSKGFAIQKNYPSYL